MGAQQRLRNANAAAVSRKVRGRGSAAVRVDWARGRLGALTTLTRRAPEFILARVLARSFSLSLSLTLARSSEFGFCTGMKELYLYRNQLTGAHLIAQIDRLVYE